MFLIYHIDLNVVGFFYREVKGSREKVISDEDLELLLDRSDLIGKYLSCPFFFFRETLKHTNKWKE